MVSVLACGNKWIQVGTYRWEVAIIFLILINSSAPIKFRIVEMDNCLNLNKRPCWDSVRDPFASEPEANLHGIKPVRLNGSFDSKCTRPETSHPYQYFTILINTFTGIIVYWHNLRFKWHNYSRHQTVK